MPDTLTEALVREQTDDGTVPARRLPPRLRMRKFVIAPRYVGMAPAILQLPKSSEVS